jgi:diacylglycerol kinase (ATP)
MEPSSSPDLSPLSAAPPPSLPDSDAQEDRTNDSSSSSDSIKIEREEEAPSSWAFEQHTTTSGREEEKGGEEEPHNHHLIDEGPHDAANPTSDHIPEDEEEHAEESAPIQPSPLAAHTAAASIPLTELDWGLLTGESASPSPSPSSPEPPPSSSSAATHPAKMDHHGHREDVLLSARPASPPLDVAAPAFRVRLDSRELASSDIVVEEVPDSSSTNPLTSLERKGKGKVHHPRADEDEGRASDDHDGTVVHHGEDGAHADGAPPQRQRSYSLLDPHKKPDGVHYFYPTSFARTMACNVCHKPIRGLSKQGLSCSICQYAVHYNCEEKSEHCCPVAYSRPSSLEKTKQMAHAWIEGNAEPGMECRSCKKEILGIDPMAASRCFWCGGAAHNGCKENTLKCDMGPHRDFKLPPYALYKHQLPNGEEKWQIEPSLLPEGCVPYLVFVNKKAGGQQGKLVFKNMLSLFNPHQVFDLSKGGPMPGLRMFFPLARRGPGFRIMVCGGDGTVNWVCQTLARVKFPRPEFAPPIALLPLGTGNDLSGYLGWGVGYTGGNLNDYLFQLHNTEIVQLDRWKSTIANFAQPDGREDSGAGLRPIDAPTPKNVKKLTTQLSTASLMECPTPVTTISNIMSSLWTSSDSLQGSPATSGDKRQALVQDDSENHEYEELQQNQDVEDDGMSSKEVHYDDDDFELEEEEDVVSGAEVKSFHHSFSIGVDAKITWNFHLAREANPENFTSRGMNKFKYFTEGVSSIIGGGCKGLAQAIEFLEIDGRLIWGEELPQAIESLIFGNIPAYADGTDLWAKPTGDYKPQRVDDKVVEVIAHKGSIHLVQIKAGVSRAYQLGQGRRIKMQTRDVLPMQLDGEPWLQGPALIQIEHRNQVSMIVPKNRKNKSA